MIHLLESKKEDLNIKYTKKTCQIIYISNI